MCNRHCICLRLAFIAICRWQVYHILCKVTLFYNKLKLKLYKSLWLSLDEILIHRRLAITSRRWYSFIYPRRMESWVSLGGKEGRINIQILAEPGIELGTLWSEGRDLTNCTSPPACPPFLMWLSLYDDYNNCSYDAIGVL